MEGRGDNTEQIVNGGDRDSGEIGRWEECRNAGQIALVNLSTYFYAVIIFKHLHIIRLYFTSDKYTKYTMKLIMTKMYSMSYYWIENFQDIYSEIYIVSLLSTVLINHVTYLY